MTYYDFICDCIDFQSEVRFSRYDCNLDEVIPMTQEEAQNKPIKYIYPIDHTAIMIEVEIEDDD